MERDYSTLVPKAPARGRDAVRGKRAGRQYCSSVCPRQLTRSLRAQGEAQPNLDLKAVGLPSV